MGAVRNVCRILVGAMEGMKSLGRPTYKREDNIKMNLSETECEGVDWIHLAQDRGQWQAVLNTVMNLQVPAGKFLTE
jgi:hypothetical protein